MWKKIPPRMFTFRGIKAVAQVTTFSPNQHPADSPIKKDMWCVKVQMVNGMCRWFGSDQQPFIGADLRMHIFVNQNDEVLSKWEPSAGPPAGV